MAGKFPTDVLNRSKDLQRCIVSVSRHYEALQELAEYTANDHPSNKGGPSALETMHVKIAKALYKDSQLASQVFTQAAKDILLAHETLGKGRLGRLLAYQNVKINLKPTAGQCRPFKDLPGCSAQHVVAAAHLCLAFAEANRAALRRFESDFCAITGNARNAAMMVQPCFRKTHLGAFLCSPLLVEMQAIICIHSQDNALEKAPPQVSRPLQGRRWTTSMSPLSFSGSSFSRSSSTSSRPQAFSFTCTASSSSDVSVDRPASLLELSATSQIVHATFWQAALANADTPETTCSICLERLYKPVGLSCGHIFCESCLHSSLQSGGCPVPQAGLRIGNPSVRTTAAQCPECRQSSRLGNAVSMRCLNNLTKMLHPAEWSEQQKQKNEEVAKLELERLENERRERHTVNYSEHNNSMGNAATTAMSPILGSLGPYPLALGLGGSGGMFF